MTTYGMKADDRLAEIKPILATFKRDGISHDPKRGLNTVLRFQDLVQQATMDDIRAVEGYLSDDERVIWIWATASCLSADCFTDLYVKTTGRRKLLAVYEVERADLAKWEAAIAARESACGDRERDAKQTVERAANEAAKVRSEKAEIGACFAAARADYEKRISSDMERITELEDEVYALAKQNADLMAVKRVIDAAVAAVQEKANA